MLLVYHTKFGEFREIIISRATPGRRREIELNFGSLPPIPGGLATLLAVDKNIKTFIIIHAVLIRV